MTRITSSDQVLLLLRNYLQRTDRTRKTRATAKAQRKSPLERAQTIALTADISDEDVRHALISGILTEEFGAAIATDARFQEVVREVVQIIAADERGRSLFDRAIAQLRIQHTP